MTTFSPVRTQPSSQMILEDHLRKCLSMSGGSQWKPYHNKLLPRNPDSAFGDFPGGSPKQVPFRKAKGVTHLQNMRV